ncbi:MAG: UDP-N-acetylmuramoyl-tripeptide--D-alanyl-D-alanine ligase [Acidobacteriaceae bacterium]|nr:UDP-N-acetylmuramoyl-tripeptide--D-alanyl-D-alanine ligase [Acidobacteriaceae bacterium]
MKLPLWRVAEYLGVQENELGAPFQREALATGYSIDSRTIRPGEVFFAVRGEKMDGHDFVDQALEKGALAAVVSKEKLVTLTAHVAPDAPVRGGRKASAPTSALIPVEDTLLALQLLAQAVRRLWERPLIAVTGSAGKTTTKEAIAHVLATRFQVHKSEGNFNNHFGLPLMLLKLEPEHDCAVVELGMSRLGEITALAQIAEPETGVVTNVAPVHLEFFKDISEIARAKYELIESLPPSGTAVLNADDEYVSQFGRDFKGRVVSYGFGPATVRAENFESRGEQGSVFDVLVGNRVEHATLPLVGSHNVQNALAAIAVALEQGIAFSEAVASLATMTPADKRGQVVRIGNITVINDCYNSNPKALAAMVDALSDMAAKRRIVVAGEMLELGPQGEIMHGDAGRHIAEKGIDVLVGVRGLAAEMVNAAKQEGIRAEFLSTAEEAGEWLARETRDGDVVLLKASRGVKLEKALEKWMQSAVSQRPPGIRKTKANDGQGTTNK